MRCRFGLIFLVLLLAACGGAGHTVTHQPKPSKSSKGHLVTPSQARFLGASPTGRTPTYLTPYGPSAHSPTFGLHPKGMPLPPHLSSTAASQTLQMLDSVDTTANSSTWNGITPAVVAGYLPPSSWPTFGPYLTEFSHAIHVAVAVRSSTFGDRRAAITCLDDEPGDATPSEAGPWVVREVMLGFRPCVYGSLSNIPSIKQSIAGQHVTAHVYYWCADWTYYAHLTSGCDATQWTDHFDSRNIDGSAVDAAFVGKGVTPSKPSVRCYHKGWPVPASDKSLCLKVRAHDSFLGKQRALEAGYLKVTNANIASVQVKLTPIQSKISTVEKRAAAEVKDRHWAQLKVSAGNLVGLSAQAVPLEKQLAPLQANAKLEQSKESSFNAQLQADLHKYGWKA